MPAQLGTLNVYDPSIPRSCAKAKEFRFHLHVVYDHSFGEHFHCSTQAEWQVRLACKHSVGQRFTILSLTIECLLTKRL